MKTTLSGQALLELAIFGAIIIMLIGILLNYGLRNNFQQRLQQQTFRKALGATGELEQNDKPSGISYLQVEDNHVVNPSDTWGLGTVYPFQAQASVNKSSQSYKVAGNPKELPVTRINIQGNQMWPENTEGFTTAGFRAEYGVNTDNIEKYKQIFGETLRACSLEGGCDPNNDIGSGWVKLSDSSARKTCIETILDPNNNPVCKDNKERYEEIRLIDPAMGQIVDYDSIISQCRQIINVNYCKSECERAKQKDVNDVIPDDQETDCNEVCNYAMNPPNQNSNVYDPAKGGAWYCRGYTPVNATADINQQYDFPEIRSIFAFTPVKRKAMGVQPENTQEVINRSSLTKTESAGGITTNDNVNYTIITKRKIRYRQSGTDNYTQEMTNENAVGVHRTTAETTDH